MQINFETKANRNRLYLFNVKLSDRQILYSNKLIKNTKRVIDINQLKYIHPKCCMLVRHFRLVIRCHRFFGGKSCFVIDQHMASQ